MLSPPAKGFLKSLYNLKSVAKWLFLQIPAFFFKMAVLIRHFFYDRGWLKVEKAPLFVVSIGNIVAGGSGKTPLTIFLAEQIQKANPEAKIAILSRGYKAKAEQSKEPIIVSDGHGPKTSWQVAGDEAFMIASRLPQLLVISGKSRLKSAKKAKEMGATVALLDDGMQHRKLFRDMELVLVNNKEGFLPAGPLRDHPSRLKSADALFLTETTGDPCAITLGFKTKEVVFANGQRITSLAGKKVGVFCGIANPHRIMESVQELGGTVVAHLFLKDHEKIEQKKLFDFRELCQKRGATYLLCTEKDWVKLDEEQKIGIGWIYRETYIKDNSGAFSALVKKAAGRKIV